MPATLGSRGFECRNTTRDRLIVTSGSFTYETTNLPPNSQSGTTLAGQNSTFRAPWYDGVGGQNEPSAEQVWFHARYYTILNNANNDGLRIGIGRDGTEYISISTEDSTNRITIRVAGTVRATSASAALSLSTWARFHVHITGDDAGDQVLVYMDGDLATPVVSYTLIGADATALSSVGLPNEFLVTMKLDSGSRIDDLIAWDPLDAGFPGINYFASCGIAGIVFTGDGAETDWSGSYTDIDERPASDADKIVAANVGDESSFTKPAISADNVFSVQVFARVTRTGTGAGSNLKVKINDGTDFDEVTVAAPGDGDISVIFDTAPDGLAWSPVKYDATRVAFVAET